MLHYFLRFELGYKGIIGMYCHDIPLFASLLLMLVYIFIPYLLGSINTAVITSGKMYGEDVRNFGSGNAGFTNMMRIYGGKAAAITFVGDIAKTVVSILIGWCVFGYLTAYIAGFASLVGHLYPVFYRFRGGKGVLSMTAMVLMLDWRIFLILFVCFVCSVAVTKYISFGSVLCSMLFPLFLNRLNNSGLYMIEIIALLSAALVVFKHRSNIKRIFNGTESKFAFKKSKAKEKDGGEDDEA